MMTQQRTYIRTLAFCFALALILTTPVLGRGETAPSPHDGISCGLCHDGAQSLAVAAGASRSGICAGCHTPDAAWQDSHSHLEIRQDAACLMCHVFHGPGAGTATAVAGKVTVTPVVTGSGHCAACHNSEGSLGSLSAAHRITGEIYHRQGREMAGLSPSQACLNCHDAGSESPWQARTEKTLTFRHKASHSYGVHVRPGQQVHATFIRPDLDPRLPLIDGKMECVTCHSLTAGTADLLVAYANPYDLCLGCHVMQPDQPAADLVATLVRR